jgi:hypothetical protein
MFSLSNGVPAHAVPLDVVEVRPLQDGRSSLGLVAMAVVQRD